MNLPAKPGKFLSALTGFAVANLCLRIIFTVIFWQFTLDNLFFYSIVSCCLWIIVITLCMTNHQQAAMVMGMVELFVYAYFTTFVLGLKGGFYLLLIAAIPLNFYNTARKKLSRTISGVLLILSIIMLVVALQVWDLNVLDQELDTSVCFLINLVGACMILAIIGYLFGLMDTNEERRLLLSNQRMMVMANTDPLTNLINRRIMMTKIEQEKERVDRGQKPFSFIMIDVDNFKQINDIYGHDGGDFVLNNLSHLINLCLRKSDLVSRWGGDEFLVMLPETAQTSGQMVAEKIRNRIMNTPFIYHEEDIPVTVTLGVSQCDALTGIGGAIRRADQALYLGKHEGKDRVVLLE